MTALKVFLVNQSARTCHEFMAAMIAFANDVRQKEYLRALSMLFPNVCGMIAMTDHVA